jgi:predicted RND superfamily exporter protein
MVGFLVLAAGTKNWAGSLTVLLTTGLVIIMVFGVYSLLDWNLDLNVATNSVLLAPLSFNVLSRLVYVYLFATPQDRDGRVLAALSGAGEPVLFSKSLQLKTLGGLMISCCSGCVGSFLAVCFIFITEDFYAFHVG